jgi:hypothetical protein
VNPVPLTKAELRELDANGKEVPGSKVVVQFNPESLKVSFSNQLAPPGNTNAKDTRGSSTMQLVGKGATKLTTQLWFDVSAASLPQGQEGETDVRKLTQKVAYFIMPKPNPKDPNNVEQKVPPGVRFLWGTFKFDGIMESLEESLEYFSADGTPLRASVSISLSQMGIQFAFQERGSAAGRPANAPPAPGTRPLTAAASGGTVQSMAAAAGKGDQWQAIALANGIENPRRLAPGQLIDLNVSLSASAKVQVR